MIGGSYRTKLAKLLNHVYVPRTPGAFAQSTDMQEMDLVNPETGEVTRGDGLIHTLVEHCAIQEGFISSNAPLVDSVFKVFIVNHNQPLDSIELAERIGKPAETILRTIVRAGSIKAFALFDPV